MSAQPAEREPHTYYSPERKAEVLALVEANGGNVYRTALDTGISRQLITYWIEHEEKYASLLTVKKAALDAKMENTLHRYIDSIYDHPDLENTSLGQKATAFGIVFDKLQLYRNLPTNITETVERQEISVLLASVLDVQP